MISSLQTVRVTLANLRSTLDVAQSQGGEALFESRNHLRLLERDLHNASVPHLMPLAKALEGILAPLLIQESLSLGETCGALKGLVDAIEGLLDAPGGVAPNPLAASYLNNGMVTSNGLSLGRSHLRSAPQEELPSFLSQDEAPIPETPSQPIRSRPRPLDSEKVARLVEGDAPAVSESRLGQVLLRQGALSPAELDRALALQQICRKKLGEALVAMELVGIEGLNRALETQRQQTLSMIQDHAPATQSNHLRLAGD